VERTEQPGIEQAVGRELGRMGVAGTVVLVGKSIELRAGGVPVAIDIDLILAQWSLLPDEMRQRKAEEIARRLVSASRASGQTAGPREIVVGEDPQARAKLAAGILGFFALLAIIGLARYFIPRLTSSEPVQSKAPSEDPAVRRERLARACDAVRDRLYKGASFGPFALEGWEVELWLAKKGEAPALRDHPALAALVSGGRLPKTADDKLGDIIDGRVEIEDGLDADAARRSPGWSAARVVFHDGYARAFLEEEHRPRFLGLADRTAAAAGADHGALYARCAHLTTHDIGAWFRGPDLAGATAVMIYQMGLFSESKVIDRSALAALREGSGELDALRRAAGEAAGSIPSFVGTAGGFVSGGKPATITFPLGAPLRPLAATRDLARKMGIGVSSGE
jgi:hypothetical protein